MLRVARSAEVSTLMQLTFGLFNEHVIWGQQPRGLQHFKKIKLSQQGLQPENFFKESDHFESLRSTNFAAVDV